MKKLFFIHALLFCSPLMSQVYTVNLGEDDTLLPFFKAGLQLKSESASVFGTCVAPPQTIIILDFGEVRLPPIRADWSVRVNAFDRISSVKFKMNRLISKEEAKELAKSFNKALGKVENEGIAEIEQTRPGNFIAKGNQVILNRGKAKLYVSYDFNTSETPEKPFLFLFSAEWSRPRKEVGVRLTPLKPPPGYEHLSMAPDPAYRSGLDQIFKEIREIAAGRQIQEAKESLDLKDLHLQESERQVLYHEGLKWGICLLLVIVLGWILHQRQKAGAPPNKS